MGYTKDVIKGISWVGFLRFNTKIVGFFELIILARILSPRQFGAYGIALLALGLLEVLTETGVNVVLVQEEDIDSHISSAWFVSIIRGIIISFILFLAAPFIAYFFHSPESLPLLYVISFVPLLRGFINPAVVKFQKNLLFGKDFWYRTAILMVDTLTSITITYITHNPIGIVIGLLTGVIIEVVLSYFIISPRPTFDFKKSYIRKIFNRGKWVTGSSIFNYLFENTDNIVVGRMLGASSLGIYQLAYSLAVVPMSEIGKVFFHVTTPVLIKIAQDRQRVKQAFFKSIGAVILITIPIVLLLVLFPYLFVLILGQKWLPLVSVLPVLALLGFVRAITGAASALFLSENKQEYTMITTLANIVGLVVTIIPLVILYGIVGAGTSALIGGVVAIPFFLYYINKIFSNPKN